MWEEHRWWQQEGRKDPQVNLCTEAEAMLVTKSGPLKQPHRKKCTTLKKSNQMNEKEFIKPSMRQGKKNDLFNVFKSTVRQQEFSPPPRPIAQPFVNWRRNDTPIRTHKPCHAQCIPLQVGIPGKLLYWKQETEMLKRVRKKIKN